MVKAPWNQSKDGEAKSVDAVEENSADKEQERKKKARSVIVTMLFMYLPALFGVINFTYELLNPRLNLELNELDVKQGIISSVYTTGGRTPKAKLQLKLADGDLVTYRSDWDNQKQLTSLIGKEVRVWGQPYFVYFGLVEGEMFIFQLEFEGKLIADYKRDYKVSGKYRNRGDGILIFGIVALMIMVVIPFSWVFIRIYIVSRKRKGVNDGE